MLFWPIFSKIYVWGLNCIIFDCPEPMHHFCIFRGWVVKFSILCFYRLNLGASIAKNNVLFRVFSFDFWVNWRFICLSLNVWTYVLRFSKVWLYFSSICLDWINLWSTGLLSRATSLTYCVFLIFFRIPIWLLRDSHNLVNVIRVLFHLCDYVWRMSELWPERLVRRFKSLIVLRVAVLLAICCHLRLHFW